MDSRDSLSGEGCNAWLASGIDLAQDHTGTFAPMLFMGEGLPMVAKIPARGAVVVALVLALAAAIQAAEPRMVEGVVVSAGQNALVMKDAAGKQHSFKVDEAAKVTFNGKPGKLEDFKASMPVLVTVGEEERVLAVSTIDDEKVARAVLR